jgi:transcriptional repressor NrdR
MPGFRGRKSYGRNDMRCPFCGNTEDRVVDSRESKEGEVIRRRRECAQCERRFTSYEKIEHQPFHVVKRDQRREPYDREKLMQGLNIACRKRPISAQQLEEVADSIERALHESGERELSSQDLGFLVMERLRELDTVAYVRFASVYRRFEDVEAFVRELHHLSESTNEPAKSKV